MSFFWLEKKKKEDFSLDFVFANDSQKQRRKNSFSSLSVFFFVPDEIPIPKQCVHRQTVPVPRLLPFFRREVF